MLPARLWSGVKHISRDILGPYDFDLIDFDFEFKFFRHGGHVSHRTDLQWAEKINTKLTNAYIVRQKTKTLFTKFLINKLK